MSARYRRTRLPQGQSSYTIKVSGGPRSESGEYSGESTLTASIARARNDFVPYVSPGSSVKIVHFDRDGERTFVDAVVKEGKWYS